MTSGTAGKQVVHIVLVAFDIVRHWDDSKQDKGDVVTVLQPRQSMIHPLYGTANFHEGCSYLADSIYPAALARRKSFPAVARTGKALCPCAL